MVAIASRWSTGRVEDVEPDRVDDWESHLRRRHFAYLRAVVCYRLARIRNDQEELRARVGQLQSGATDR